MTARPAAHMLAGLTMTSPAKSPKAIRVSIGKLGRAFLSISDQLKTRL
jgi:hypothetical protein